MRRVLIAVVALACSFAGVASAGRAPRGAERSAILSSVSGYIRMPNSPAASDNRVVSLAVSTLDRRYASARLTSTTVGSADMVLHESHGTWWVLTFGSSLNCSSAPKAVLDDLKVGCTPPDAAAWINDCGPLVSSPKTLVLACADAGYELARLTWRGWGTARATATGVARANDCTPNCAAGHFHSYRMHATAGSLTPCGKARFYARLTIVYAAARPAGIAKHSVNRLGC